MTTLLNINLPDKMNPSIKAMSCQLKLIFLCFLMFFRPTHYTKTYAIQLSHESDIIYAKDHGVKNVRGYV